MEKEFNVVVCASGGGGNFQALIDSETMLGIKITRLIVDRECGAINRAVKHNIPHFIFKDSEELDYSIEFDKKIPIDTDLIVLAGYMSIIPKEICDNWSRKIINIHPSLLPKHGGKGMYGVRIQEAVMRENDKKAGCTVHFVNHHVDGGEIILQKSIDVDYNETPWQLGGRIFQEENKLLVEAVNLIKSVKK